MTTINISRPTSKGSPAWRSTRSGARSSVATFMPGAPTFPSSRTSRPCVRCAAILASKRCARCTRRTTPGNAPKPRASVSERRPEVPS